MSGIPDVMAALGLEVDPALDAPREHRPPSRRRQARPRTETEIRTDCANEIRARGGHCMVKHQTMYGTKGTPDLIGCLGGQIVVGRMVVVECKRSDADPPDPAQLGRLRKWQEAGALACWVRSAEHLRQVLTHLDDPEWRNDFTAPGDGRDS